MGAADVPVRLFREILIWPLAVEPKAGTSLKATVTAFGKRLDGHPAWTAIRDLRRHLDPVHGNDGSLSAQAYAEVVYFHPFVQRFLFPRPTQDEAPAVRLFRRRDVKRVRLVYAEKVNELSIDRDVELSVDRVHLYLFDSGIAVLAVEVSSVDGLAIPAVGPHSPRPVPPDRPLRLKDVQVILSGLRHAYPPFWAGDVPGLCLKAVEWLCNDPREPERPLTRASDSAAKLCEYLTEHGHPPSFAHWRALLAPLEMDSLRHVVDDRIPTMALVGVEDPHAIDRGDLMRLCFADPPGPDPLPYAEGFLQEFEKTHCYDRFWQEDGGPDTTTRYLCSGYNFVVVGQAYDGGKWSFFRDVINNHFRRHYFQLGLLAHHQKAALLTLSDAVSQAVDKGRLDGAMDGLHRRALEFTHRFWFTDVTNQIQGQELFELWTRHLNTRAIFEQVNREVTESSTYLSTHAALRLNRIAGYGLVLALTSGVLGMNVLVGGKWTEPADWAETGMVLFAVIVGMIGAGWAYARERLPSVLIVKRPIVTALFLVAVMLMVRLGIAVHQHSAQQAADRAGTAAETALTAR